MNSAGPSYLISVTRVAILAISVGLLFILFFEDSATDAEYRRRELRRMDFKENPTYTAECGSCHLAYPPGLLPERSWTSIMANLVNHFGLDADVDPAINSEITIFLKENAADHGSRRSKKIADSIPISETPWRFTETKFYRSKHADLADQTFSKHSIRSKSNCDACHPKADHGEFFDRDARIPE